jgi:ERCC4-type nuclease
MTVIVDEREPEAYHSLGDEVQTLPVGDYLVIGSERKYAIERKYVDDLVSSAKGGRLWNQLGNLSKLREQEDFKVMLVVEGNLEELMMVKPRFRYNRKEHKPMFIGDEAVITQTWWRGVQIGIASFGITIIRVANKTEFNQLIEDLKIKVGQSRSYTSNKKPARMNKHEAMKYFLCGIPNLGPTKAEKILAEYGTPAQFFAIKQWPKYLAKDEVRGIELAVYGIEQSL